MNCDHCAQQIRDVMTAKMTLTHVRGSRASLLRAWAFCSDRCQTTWWKTATDEDFAPVRNETNIPKGSCSNETCDASCQVCGGKGEVDLPPELYEPTTDSTAADRDLTMDVWHKTPGNNDSPPVMSLDFETPTKLNTWWKTVG